MGFRFDDEAPCRIGLVNRRLDGPVRWFDIDPCWVWHTLCAWDDRDEVVLWAARIGSPTRVDKHGRSLEDLPMIDDEYRFDSHPHEWRFNLATGRVSERQLDDALVEFPRVNDANICSGARYGYFAEIGRDHRTLKTEALLKYDLTTGSCDRIAMPDGWYANEPCFAARPNAAGEDDGWVLSYVTSQDDGRSELWILDAPTFDPEPVARVVLPQRKPQGFHTRWVPTSAIGH
ncbi:MAG: carotenoid oxygenase family protein [Ilumatobacteraceae bacterium]